MSESADTTLDPICDDLTAEHDALDRVVADLDEAAWRRDTPAAGWTIADSVCHLWFFDERALMALDPATRDAYLRDSEQLLAATDQGLDTAFGRSVSGAELLDAWRTRRRALVSFARTVDPGERVPWYGPAMAARSFITARLMETWAHGQDVRDALRLAPEISDRLRHVAHIGVRARPFALRINGLGDPAGDVRVELAAPGGETWTWGDEQSTDRVTGPAIDFCLVVTQRRHLDDTSLSVEGEHARRWMHVAQAFAGPPGPGREPLRS
jgi:uncharacterized protein (TIGR03084 family)